jgi:putative ABC transport system permease protein
MENLITANIRSRPTRTVISILAVGIGVILVLVIGGIMSGTLDDYLGRNVGVGADFIVQQTGSSVFYAFSTPALPVKLAEVVRAVPGVSAVAPILAKFNSSDFGLIFGINLAEYNQFSGRLKFVEGREELSGNQVIVDEIYAKTHNVQLGSELTILNHKFTVSGICRAGAVVRVFLPLDTLQEMNGAADKVTLMFVKASPDANQEEVYSRLKARLPGYGILRANDPSLLLAGSRMPGLKELQFTIILVSVLLSFMVILLAMYTTIFERTREIGILKSLGASRAFIVGMILRESVMISGLGVAFGVGTSEIIRKVIVSAYPTLQVSMSAREILFGCALGLLGGTLGALYPAYKAARMDPVRALMYE